MSFEGAFRAQRTEFIEETTTGSPVADPTWKLYSDALQAFRASPGHQIGIVRGLGAVDPLDFQAGREEPSAMVRYFLQRDDLTADPLNDGITRAADGSLPNTHHILRRVITDLTGSAHSGGATRVYTVVEGGHIGRASIRGAGNEDPPKIVVEHQYGAEKVRAYQVDQPASAVGFSVVSTSAADTTQTLTIEDDSGTIEGVALTGTTPVLTIKVDWGSIDALRLDAECAGDVTVKVVTTLELLATLYGTLSYDGGEGDLGIPLIGSGAHASAIGDPYQSYLGDVVEYDAAAIGQKLRMTELVVDNGIEIQPTNTRRAALEVGERNIQIGVDVFGRAESAVAFVRNLTAQKATLTWVVTDGASNNTLSFANAALTTNPEQAYELGQVISVLNQQYGATGLTIATT